MKKLFDEHPNDLKEVKLFFAFEMSENPTEESDRAMDVVAKIRSELDALMDKPKDWNIYSRSGISTIEGTLKLERQELKKKDELHRVTIAVARDGEVPPARLLTPRASPKRRGDEVVGASGPAKHQLASPQRRGE